MSAKEIGIVACGTWVALLMVSLENNAQVLHVSSAWSFVAKVKFEFIRISAHA